MGSKLTRVGMTAIVIASLGAFSAAPAVAKKKSKTKTVSATYNKCVDLSQAIPDPASTASGPAVVARTPITIPKLKGKFQDGAVTSFTSAGLRIAHTYAGDITANLVSPGGAVVTLTNGRGDTADGFGTGPASCAGSLVLFGDSFLGSLLTLPAADDTPVSGSFKAEQPLSTFVGGRARGDWLLIVSDASSSDLGSLNALSLNFTYSYKARAKSSKKK